ncbi:GNAT family N-acetyltransferase [Chitinophaga agrisoli]|uniref:GNAT family N-acetyltransferase n=1 Tax=Chitinophaga agrisoli TaxID=2607653 RepID=A0A5B2VUE1_9BACT|nr:GNAT family N-acetyltransferase [Chitinophaga agrisoli]KAA2243423.1 GNAT family N-acetyltransferase [Chitinophaga agrisoli]
MQTATIRLIQPQDDPQLAIIIRQVLTDFGANKPGTAFFDAGIDHMYRSFCTPSAAYWVLTQDEQVLGGAGIYPTPGLPAGCCELVKLYLLAAARGKGLGKQLLEQCCISAGEMGFTQLYLETLPELYTAIPLYEKMGFVHLSAPLGQSGHYGCSVWMIKDL